MTTAEIGAAEVAAALNRYPGVQAGRVTANMDSHGETEMIAYLSMDPGIDPKGGAGAGELRAYLHSQFPNSRFSVMFVRLDSLPPRCSFTRRAA
jgi:acyl-coenzyme A synthetase/AMP-(fatty) acid ligase